MIELSARAQALLLLSESRRLYYGIETAQIQELLDRDRQKEIARAALAQAGVTESPVFLEFGATFGGRTLLVRGDPPLRRAGLHEPWDVAGGKPATIARRHSDGGWIVQCLEYRQRSTTAFGLHENGMLFDFDGPMRGAPKAAPFVAIASTFERFFEWEALLDERFDRATGFRLRGPAPDGAGRHLAGTFDLAPVVEASDAFLGAWKSDDALVRSRPAPGGGAHLDVLVAREDQLAEAASLFHPPAPKSARWPASRR